MAAERHSPLTTQPIAAASRGGAPEDSGSGSLLARAADALARRPQPSAWRLLAVAIAVESACLLALGAVHQTRHILGLPGSVMALVSVVAGAVGGPAVGLVTALAGGAVYAATVASLGARGSWPATITSIVVWSATALAAGALGDALRGQHRQLRRASDYNRSLLEASLDALVTIGPTGQITDVNEATEHLTGATREQLIGSDFSDYFTNPQEARRGYERVFDEGLVIDYPLAIHHPSGRVTDVLYNATVYRSEAGEVIGVFAAARDITERKRAEEGLRRASNYNRSLLEASLDALVTIGPDGKITDVNEATERVTGVPRERMVGSDFSDYFTDPHQARRGYERVFEEGLVTDYPLAIRHALGTVTDVLYNATVYHDEGGAVAGVFAAARDVTERKRAEEALLRAEAALRAERNELARSNAELEQFAYVASHDLQEPLRMVASYTQLLARRYEGKLDEDAHEFIGYAVDGATRMQQLISDLLAFSRVGTRGKPLEPMESQAAYEEAVTNLELSIEECDAEVSADPLPAILGDHMQIVQLLQNLIGNAIKFHGESAPRVHVSAQRRDSDWLFSVADNGIGIDPQYFERIFVIFQRLQGRREFPGTGIGLALCQKIVARHHGRIWVESEPALGSTFYFTIPIQGES